MTCVFLHVGRTPIKFQIKNLNTSEMNWLLPWSGPDGKPCYLNTDDKGGYMSRLADNMEAVQLGAAGYLRKPFTADQIKEKLGRLF